MYMCKSQKHDAAPTQIPLHIDTLMHPHAGRLSQSKCMKSSKRGFAFDRLEMLTILTFSHVHRFKSHQLAHLSKVLTFEKPGLRPEDEALMSLRRGGGSWAII